MRILFGLSRVVAGASALGALAILVLVVAVHNMGLFFRGALKTLGSVITMFASGFQKTGTAGPPPGLAVSAPQLCLSLLFVAMIVSVFTPDSRRFLHVVALLAAFAGLERLWAMASGSERNLLYLPVLLLWAVYYGLCVRWRWVEFGL